MSWECDTLLHFHVNMRWKSFQTLPLFSCVFCSLLLTLIYFCSSPFSQAIVGTGKTMKTLLKHVEAFKPKMIKVAGWVAAVKTLMGKKIGFIFLFCASSNLNLDVAKDKDRHWAESYFSQVAGEKNPTHHATSSWLYVPVATFPAFINHRHAPTLAICLLFQTLALRYLIDLWLDMPWTITSTFET